MRWRSEDSVGKAPVKSRSFRLFLTHQLKVRPVTEALREPICETRPADNKITPKSQLQNFKMHIKAGFTASVLVDRQ